MRYPRFGLCASTLALCAACARPTAPAPPRPISLPFATDTLLTQVVSPGVARRYIYAPSGPWAINVLEVDLDACYAGVAVKGAPGAIGREKTSTLLRNLAATRTVIGGVNADFFLFTPPGVPSNALISGGRVITGPGTQPVIAFDSTGAPYIGGLRAAGAAIVNSTRYEIEGWNRPLTNMLSVFDRGWGPATDTASATVEVVLDGTAASRVVQVDTLTAGVSIPERGRVLMLRTSATPTPPAAAARDALRALRPGDAVPVDVALAPLHPLEAVGGRPLLVKDSVVVSAVDTEGQAGFANSRHPRTAAGVARQGKLLILVVVDGRQAPFSDGMTLRELARLMLSLGARDAINLDGGGSTTFVYAAPDSNGTLRVGNRPSDPAGERPVGDALGIVQGCVVR